jgi:hypothetical protein
MKTFSILVTAVIAASSAAYGQQQPASGPKTCSQAATFVKQQCSSTYRPVQCRNNIEQNRLRCLETGTWQPPSGPPIRNLRRE